MLKLPADALPAHVEAVLRMVAGSADIEGAAPGVPCDRYLRTVHLDMSGHPLTTAQVKMLLLEAPFTLKQCFMLEGLVLAGCHLQPGAAASFVLPRLTPRTLMFSLSWFC